MVLGSLPNPPAGPARMSDKALHFVGFALLGCLACRAVRYLRAEASATTALLCGFAASALVGGALEVWQGALAYRSCELMDWVADTLGAALGAAAMAGLWAFWKPGAPA
jgi:VanZ family protein